MDLKMQPGRFYGTVWWAHSNYQNLFGGDNWCGHNSNQKSKILTGTIIFQQHDIFFWPLNG